MLGSICSPAALLPTLPCPVPCRGGLILGACHGAHCLHALAEVGEERPHQETGVGEALLRASGPALGQWPQPSHTPHPRPQLLLEPYPTLSLGTGNRLWSCWPPTVAYLGAPQHPRSAPARGSVTSPSSSLSDHLIVLYSHGSPD